MVMQVFNSRKAGKGHKASKKAMDIFCFVAKLTLLAEKKRQTFCGVQESAYL